jgi:hypothetical protein
MPIKTEVLGRNDMMPTSPRSAATLALLTLFAAPAAGETIDQVRRDLAAHCVSRATCSRIGRQVFCSA